VLHRILKIHLLVVALLMYFPACGSSAEPAPAPRPIYPRFDLTYLPEIGEQGLLGLRPAEMSRYAKGAELEVATQLFMMMLSQMYQTTDLDTSEFPNFAAIEQCVFSLTIQITTPKANERGQFIFGARTPCMIRTVDAFDWKNFMGKLFPKSAPKRLAGRTYLRQKLDTPATKDEVPYSGAMCFFIPDNRTLVVCNEEEMFEFLDRLAGEKPGPTPPPGWSEVDRDFAAFVIDLREQKLVTGKFPPDYPWGKDLLKLLDSCQTIAFGFSLDERTALHAVGTTKNAAGSQVAKRSLQRLMKAAKDKITVEAEEGLLKTMALEILTGMSIEVSDIGLSLTASAERNILELLIKLSGKAY